MNHQYFVYPYMFAAPLSNYGYAGMGFHLFCVFIAVLLLILPERIFPTKANHACMSLAFFGIGQAFYAVAAITPPLGAEQMRMWAAILHLAALLFWAYGVFRPVYRQWRYDRIISRALRKRTDFFK